MPDSILALHVRQNKLRPVDRNGIDEEAKEIIDDQPVPELMISAVDDSENVYVLFYNINSKTCNVRQTNIKKTRVTKEAAKSLEGKHFFGMGYPYFITGYDRHVAVTSDYGVLLFSMEQSGNGQGVASAAGARQWDGMAGT